MRQSAHPTCRRSASRPLGYFEQRYAQFANQAARKFNLAPSQAGDRLTSTR